MPSTTRSDETAFGGEGLLVDHRYRLREELASGSGGAVWVADDVNLRRPVAVKFAHGRHATKERLFAEAAALASIRNEHVVRVYDVGAASVPPFFVMELVEGESLQAALGDDGATTAWVPLHRGLVIARGIASGLGAAHAAGILHRDVKPANVVIEAGTGRTVLVDFGLSGERERPDIVFGTPLYMAPELCSGPLPRRALPESDLYSLGCVMFELLTGAPPFVGATVEALLEQHAHAPPPILSTRRPELESCDELVACLLEKQPERRPRTGAEVAAGIDRILYTLHADPARRPAAPRILIVDDDPLFCRVAAECARVAFAECDTDIVVAETGAAAVASAWERRPDILILDWNLPDANGIEVLSVLRADRETDPRAVVVASGAMGRAEGRQFALLGVTNFVEKPASPRHLVSLFEAAGRSLGWVLGRPEQALM